MRYPNILVAATLIAGVCATLGAAALTPAPPEGIKVPAPLSPPEGQSVHPMGRDAAARLLMQGTFGGTLTDIALTSTQTYEQWFAAQAAISPTLILPRVIDGADNVNWTPAWFDNVVLARDQLRQRMAFALSETLVVSGNGGPLWGRNHALAGYYDLLIRNALGNYRTLLEQVSVSPAMGEFLSTFRNDKENKAKGVHADQNYARELMQLFTVGLFKLSIDGTVMQDDHGQPIPTYNQNDVEQLSNVFTGWASKPTNHTGEQAWQYDLDEIDPMVEYRDHHDRSAKTIIGGALIPAGGSAHADLAIALDVLFHNPNVGPFIGKQLIQRLVTSNPSPAYVQRVAQAFNDNGSGIRGDLLAVAKAILTDPEAIAPAGPTGGKLREPLIRLTNLWRAFSASNSAGHVNEYQVVMNAGHYYGQYPLDSPSVFNFFRPDYELTEPSVSGQFFAPEFQITNENTLVLTDNQFQREAYQFIDGSNGVHAGPDMDDTRWIGKDNVMLHTSEWEAAAKDPDALVDQLALVLMDGLMTPDMRNTLIRYARAVPATELSRRVAETAELLINSPQYAIQR